MPHSFSRFLVAFILFFIFSGNFNGIFAQNSSPYKLLQTNYDIRKISNYGETPKGFHHLIDELMHTNQHYISKFSDDGEYALAKFHILKRNSQGRYQEIFKIGFDIAHFVLRDLDQNKWDMSMSGDAKYAVLLVLNELFLYRRTDDTSFELFQQFVAKDRNNIPLSLAYYFGRSLLEMNIDDLSIITLDSSRSLFEKVILLTKGPDGKFKEQYQTLLEVGRVINTDVTPDFEFLFVNYGPAEIGKNYSVIIQKTFRKIFQKTGSGYKEYYSFPSGDNAHTILSINDNADVVVFSDGTIWEKKKEWNNARYEKIQFLGDLGRIWFSRISDDGSTLIIITRHNIVIWQRGDDGLYKEIQILPTPPRGVSPLGTHDALPTITPDAKTIFLYKKIYVRE